MMRGCSQQLTPQRRHTCSTRYLGKLAIRVRVSAMTAWPVTGERHVTSPGAKKSSKHTYDRGQRAGTRGSEGNSDTCSNHTKTDARDETQT